MSFLVFLEFVLFLGSTRGTHLLCCLTMRARCAKRWRRRKSRVFESSVFLSCPVQRKRNGDLWLSHWESNARNFWFFFSHFHLIPFPLAMKRTYIAHVPLFGHTRNSRHNFIDSTVLFCSNHLQRITSFVGTPIAADGVKFNLAVMGSRPHLSQRFPVARVWRSTATTKCKLRRRLQWTKIPKLHEWN